MRDDKLDIDRLDNKLLREEYEFHTKYNIFKWPVLMINEEIFKVNINFIRDHSHCKQILIAPQQELSNYLILHIMDPYKPFVEDSNRVLFLNYAKITWLDTSQMEK